MGMDAAKLSKRLKQPGHDQTFKESESNFYKALVEILGEDDWEIVDHPKELAKMIGGRFGVVPEAKIVHKKTKRPVYFEVKKQGPLGNADERAAKHHTVQFVKSLHKFLEPTYGDLDYHPYVTIMAEDLATNERYVFKHPTFFEEGQYFCWVNYELDLLRDFLSEMEARWRLTG